MYILLTGSPPFNGRNDGEIISRVKSGRYSMNKPQFRYISSDAKDLLQKMLTFDPNRRPTAQQCYDHRWFKNEHKIHKTHLHSDTLKNFKNFQVLSNSLIISQYRTKLQRALYFFLADNLVSNEERKRLTETFKALDTNGDGALSKKEIKNGKQPLLSNS